jgi:uncharacterized protein (DUF1684 family)
MKLLLFCLLCLPTLLSAQNYTQRILQERAIKDSLFRYGDHSPVKKITSFTALVYYAPDSAYSVQATYVPLEKVKQIKMRTTHNGAPRLFRRAGELQFSIAGKPYKLFAYQAVGARNLPKGFLFVPFYDETSGKETYGGGRYLDLILPKEGKTIALDFNQAYSPYCAYSADYVCPIPPKENRLPTKIEAGEKVWQKE